MSVTLDVLDPRHDPEPPYWEGLTAAAQQHLIWSYELLRIAAWTARTPFLPAVLRDGPNPVGAVCASLTGIPVRRGAYIPKVWFWADHMKIFLGHYPSKNEAFVFIAVHVVLALLILFLPGRFILRVLRRNRAERV